MSRAFLCSVVVLFALAPFTCATEKMNAIPLDQIWGLNIPGTRDVRELEPKRDTQDMPRYEYLWGSFVNRIEARLSKGPRPDEKVEPAFVVVGTGKEALKNADKVFLGRQPRIQVLPRDTDLTLVFFSHSTMWELRFESVEKSASSINIKYRFVATWPKSRWSAGNSLRRFALIPIGKFSEGEVRVNIEQVPAIYQDGELAQPAQDIGRLVCESTVFDVQ